MRDIRSMRRSAASIIHIWRRITTVKAVILPVRLAVRFKAVRFKATRSKDVRHRGAFKVVRFKAVQLQISLFRDLFRAQLLPVEDGRQERRRSRDRQEHQSRQERAV